MEKEEIKFDIVILGDSLLKYSPFAFGNAFINIEYLLDEKISKTHKNLDDYFKIYGPITDYEGNSYIFKSVTTFNDMGKEFYHINFKKIKNNICH